YVVFRGRLRTMEFGVGDESSEVELVALEDIPWDQLAFPVIREILARYAADRQQGQFQTHFGELPSWTFKF
ncbi:MAG: NUDIX hydrolase, partial [Nitrospirota bacterium]